MFQSLRNRFSKDDDAKAERKAREAEKAAKRHELEAERRRQYYEERARQAGRESGG